jgi:hypothetical protein
MLPLPYGVLYTEIGTPYLYIMQYTTHVGRFSEIMTSLSNVMVTCYIESPRTEYLALMGIEGTFFRAIHFLHSALCSNDQDAER